MKRVAVLVFALLSATAARANEAPPDLGVDWALVPDDPSFVLPEPPQDFATEKHGRVTWTYPAAARNTVRDLQRQHADAWLRVTRELRDVETGPITIRVGRSPEEMAALAPVGHPPPGYASGVAYPAFNVILLTLSAPETWERPDLETVLTHELSHLALYRAVRGRPLPRWFVEGLAIQQAREYRLPRMQALMEAVFRDGVVPLRSLSRDFPPHAFEVNAAYAQSADMVGFLRQQNDGQPFSRLIESLHAGTPFEEAVRKAYGRRLAYLETVWREDLYDRYRGVPLFFGGGGILSLAAFVALFLFVKRRRDQKRRLHQMGLEEQAHALAVASAHLKPEPQSSPEEGAELIHGPAEVPARESVIPTVHHEGRHHTLH